MHTSPNRKRGPAFSLEPDERRQLKLRLRLLPGESPTDLEIFARAWNCDPGSKTTAPPQ